MSNSLAGANEAQFSSCPCVCARCGKRMLPAPLGSDSRFGEGDAPMISRRTFAKLTLGVLATPGVSAAQPARKIPTIAVLSGTTADYALPYIEMGRQGMRDL